MAKCSECVFYKEVDETKGDCSGHEVPADRDTSECPTNAFKPKKDNFCSMPVKMVYSLYR